MNYMQRNSTYTGYVREVLISVCVYQAGLGCLTNKGLVTTTTADTSPCACPALCRLCGEKLSSYEDWGSQQTVTSHKDRWFQALHEWYY